MLEIALVLAASILGSGAGLYFLRDLRRGSSPAGRPQRDDVLLALGVALLLGATAGLRMGKSPFDAYGVRGAAFFALSVALGAGGTALAARARAIISARAVERARERLREERAFEHALASFAPGAFVGTWLTSILLSLLCTVASITGRVLSDPQHLAPTIVPLVTAYALGACLPSFGTDDAGDPSETLETCAAMLVGAHFFQVNAGALHAGPLYASALGLVLFPLAARAVFAVASLAGTFAVRRTSSDAPMRALRQGFYVGATLVLLALAGVAASLLGSLALPCLFAGATGVAATVAVFELARRGAGPAALLTATFFAAGFAAIASATVLARTEWAHGAALGVVMASVGAAGATGTLRVLAATPSFSAGARDEDGEHVLAIERETSPLRACARHAEVVALALGAVVVPLAVLDATSDAACARWALTANLPAADGAALLAACDVAGLGVTHIDLARPAVLVAAAAGLPMSLLTPSPTLASRATGVLVTFLVVLLLALLLRAFDGHAAEGAAAAALVACILGVKDERTRRSTALFGAAALSLAPLL
jgi:hypothetical protein